MPEPVNYVSRMRALIRREFQMLPAGLIDLYTLLALTRGNSVTMKDVHDAWAVWCNDHQPGHGSLLPFGQLTPGVQELDREFMDGIRRAVEEYHAEMLRDRL